MDIVENNQEKPMNIVRKTNYHRFNDESSRVSQQQNFNQ